jgi:uncharacterized protein (DUF697 family)
MSSYADTIGRVMSGDFDQATDADRARAVRELIQVCSIAAAAVAVQPVPLLDIALLAPIQIAMVQGIGRIHGQRLDRKSVLEILSTFGASLVSQSVIMAAAKLLPFFGWAAALSMAYALTYAIGEVSDHYFKTGRGVSPDALKEMFEKTYTRKRAEKEASTRGESELRTKLDALTRAYDMGLLTEEEFARKKEELIRSHAV